jgi:hypothetical protein
MGECEGCAYPTPADGYCPEAKEWERRCLRAESANDAEHRMLLHLLRVLRDKVDGGYCLTELLFDCPQDEINALIGAIKQVPPKGEKKKESDDDH